MSNFKPLPPAGAQSFSNSRFVFRIFNFHLPAVKTRPAFIETSLFAHRSLVLMLGSTSLKHHPNKVYSDIRLNFRKLSAISIVLITLEGVHPMRFAIFDSIALPPAEIQSISKTCINKFFANLVANSPVSILVKYLVCHLNMGYTANQRYAYICFIFSKISGKPHESKLGKNKGWVFNLYRSIAASWHTTFSKWVKREIFQRCQMMSVNI